MIVLDRIAAENPSEIRHQAEWLMSIATGADFPHILIREYAKTAALKLLDGQNDAYARKRQQLLSRTNVSRRKRKAPHQQGARPFRGRGEGWGDDERRFHFDPMDTLPYWYLSERLTSLQMHRRRSFWTLQKRGLSTNGASTRTYGAGRPRLGEIVSQSVMVLLWTIVMASCPESNGVARTWNGTRCGAPLVRSFSRTLCSHLTISVNLGNLR